ncbi:AsnC family protein [Achromobacter xylosoxidans]
MPALDDTDLACLIALQADPRASWRELGRPPVSPNAPWRGASSG